MNNTGKNFIKEAKQISNKTWGWTSSQFQERLFRIAWEARICEVEWDNTAEIEQLVNASLVKTEIGKIGFNENYLRVVEG